MINSPVLFSIYRTTCPHFIPTTIFYSIMKDRKAKDYQGLNRQGSDQKFKEDQSTDRCRQIICFHNRIKMALGVIEGKEATKNRSFGHILCFLSDRYTIFR